MNVLTYRKVVNDYRHYELLQLTDSGNSRQVRAEIVMTKGRGSDTCGLYVWSDKNMEWSCIAMLYDVDRKSYYSGNEEDDDFDEYRNELLARASFILYGETEIEEKAT